MEYTLIFKSDEESRNRYAICIESFLAAKRTVQVGEADAVIGTLRKLKAIGTPSEMIGRTQLYDLATPMPGATEVRLTRSERDILLRFMGEPIWRPAAIEQVMDTVHWLTDLKPGEVA